MIFKHELPILYSKTLREQSLDSSISKKQSSVLKQQRSDKLDSILRSSCNPTFTKVEREKFLSQNSCKKYYDKKISSMNLLVLHPNYTNYVHLKLPEMKKEAAFLIEQAKELRR